MAKQRTWREDNIRQVLPPNEAEQVLNVPIPQIPREDVLRWSFTKDGGVLVKSADYRLRERGRKEGDRRLHQSKWTTIWKTYVWSKVKSYMWKLASNALPVRANLERRGISISPLCLACDEDDTSEHMVSNGLSRYGMKCWGLMLLEQSA